MQYQRFFILATLTLVACGSSGVEVTRGQYGNEWPFTVDWGVVDCVDGQAAIFRTGGEAYQLNGFAKSRGYASIDPIWRANPDVPGLKINIGPMIDLALKQC